MYEIKIPHQIKVGGHSYPIKTSKGITRDLSDRARRGEHSDLHREISLSTDVKPQEMSCTFIHECCHAVDSVYCCGRLSEDDIKGMGHGIHQVMEQLGVRFVR